MSAKATFLITGCMGCIGAWVLKNLVEAGHQVVATDMVTTISRPALLLSKDQLADIQWEALDVTDAVAVNATLKRHKPDCVIHLAGLQIPFCKANPVMGAAVNVLGSVNMFEAVREQQIKGFSYASSLAVLGPESDYEKMPLGDDAIPLPRTLYGVYKAANEATAKVYWQDHQVGSVGLRPYCVFGVARDQGLTADLAKAVLAIAAGQPFHIRFDGGVTLQHADDVAKIFIQSALANHTGAAVLNLRNDVFQVSDYVELLMQLYPDANITCETGAPLPFPYDLSDDGLQSLLGTVPHTPIEQAVQADVERFRHLISEGRVDLAQLSV